MGIRIVKNGKKVEKNEEPKITPKKNRVAPNLIEAEQKASKVKKATSKVVIKKNGTGMPKEGKDRRRAVLTTTSDEKMALSYSRLRSYIICPKRFELHTKYGWKPKDETKKVLQGGLVFEAVVFDDKDGILEMVDPKKFQKIIKQAEAFNKNGVFVEGESFIKINYEHKLFTIRGEIDFRGNLNTSGEVKRKIADLKFTGKIDYIWQDFKYKEDALQLIIYSWIHYKNTGEMLDVAYVIVEATYEDPVFQIREVSITEETYKWVENFLIKVAVEPIKIPKPSNRNCLGGKAQGRCPWLQYCNSGRKLLGGIQSVDADILESKVGNNSPTF